MGPTSAIWLSPETESPAQDELLSIARLLDPATTSHTDFGIATTRPIGGSTDASGGARGFGMQISGTRFDEDELVPIAELLKFQPRAAIHIFAFANSTLDHRILAEVTLYLVRRFGGVVDLGGDLGSVEATKGWLVSIPYEGVFADATFHLADAAFLETWLTDPRFHMIK